MFNWADRVHQIQMDITSYCNASCGACIRNDYGGKVKPDLPLSHFDLDLWKLFLQRDLKNKHITKLAFNGNWGDAGMHPDLYEMIKLLRHDHPETQIAIATNGSMRSTEFWRELGELLSGSLHRLEVAVDGLADTHSIYRRGTDYNRIIENIKAFVAGGGYCHPIVTVFDHNEHQLDEIVEQLRLAGCQAVDLRESHNRDILIKTETENFKITAPKFGHKKHIEWQESPDSKYIRKNMRILAGTKLETKCPWHNVGDIQIDPWGSVWPCCHVSSLGQNLVDNDRVKEKITVGERMREFNNLRDNSLEDILNNHWYTSHLPETLNNEPYMICKKSCNV